LDEAVSYAIQICEAMKDAHAKGIVHRDIKSENIMVNSKNQVKVMDFGIAKLEGSAQLTRTGNTLGTVVYMSPEQLQGGEVDARSDIFSFGVVFYEMVTGRLPFRGDHVAAMMYSIVNEEPLIRTLPDSHALQEIIAKCLSKKKTDRYQTADEIQYELKSVQHNLTTERPLSIDRKLKRPWFRGRIWVSSAAGIITVAMIGVLLFFRRDIVDSVASSRDTIYVSPIISTFEDTSEVAKGARLGGVPVTNLDPLTDLELHTLSQRLLPKVITELSIRTVVMSHSDFLRVITRKKIIPWDPAQIRNMFHEKGTLPDWLYLFIHVYKATPDPQGNAYLVAMRYRYPLGAAYVMGQRVGWAGIDSVVLTSVKDDLVRKLGNEPYYTVKGVSGERVILESGGWHIARGMTLHATRKYKPYADSADAGVKERLKDLEGAVKFYKTHLGWDEYLVIDSSRTPTLADGYWNAQEYYNLSRGILLLKSEGGAVFHLGVEVLVEEIYDDSTAIGHVVSKKYPWVVLKPGDQLHLP
jgi:hypothetical protein